MKMKDESLFSLANIQRQYIACRRHKRYTANALRFEARQELNPLALRDALVEHSDEPARCSLCICSAAQAARDLRRRLPRSRAAPCAGWLSGGYLGAAVHPRQLCLPQGQRRACRGGAVAAVHAPGHGQWHELNYFRAKKQFSSGVIEGLNNKAKVTLRKAYGYRTFRIAELSLYHVLGRLPEPKLAHRFF